MDLDIHVTPMDYGKTAVTVAGVSKSFGPVSVLENISFSVDEDEIVVLLGASGPGFGVTVTLPKATYTHGETTTVIVRPSRDSYLYLFNVDSEGGVTALVPNAAEKVPLVKAGAEYSFPSAALRAKGVVARATLPPGVKVSREVMKVVAIRAQPGKPPLALLKPNPGGATFGQHGAKSTDLIGEVLCKLAAQDSDSWTDGRAEFTVVPAGGTTAAGAGP